MASYSFKLSGTATAEPSSGTPSGTAIDSIPLEEAVTLVQRAVLPLQLAADAPYTLTITALSGFASGAHVIVIRATGGKVKVDYTSADGTLQSVPADPMQLIISKSVPITTLRFTRVAGTLTDIALFLGAKA